MFAAFRGDNPIFTNAGEAAVSNWFRTLSTCISEAGTVPSTTVPLTRQVLKLRMQEYEASRVRTSGESLAKARSGWTCTFRHSLVPRAT